MEQEQEVSRVQLNSIRFPCIDPNPNPNTPTTQTQVSYTNLEALLAHGIATADIEKLNAEGFYTVESIAHATIRKLSEVKGISEAKVLKLKEITKSMVPMDFKTAADALVDRSSIVCLTTGAVELDKLLCGGVETGR